jgi:hypothetical protein
MSEQEIGGPGTALVERAERAPTRGIGGGIGLLRPIAPIAEIIEVQNETRKFIHTALVEGRDYGVIPGTDGKKKAMFKPGAERVNVAFGVVARFDIVEKEVDHDRTVQWEKQRWRWHDEIKGRKVYYIEASGESRGLYRYVIRCQLYRGDTFVGEGIGSCSTMEAKYVDRPRDLENTAIKMSKKRAFVDATLTTFGLSDEFSQDYEDEESADDGAAAAAPEQRRVQRKRTQYRKPTKEETEQADEIYRHVTGIWDGKNVPLEHRPDDVRVALANWDAPRTPDGIPDIDKLGPSEMQVILEYVRGRYVKPAPSQAPVSEPAKAPAATAPDPEASADPLRLRKVGKLIHLDDPRASTRDCIGCGEPLSGQRTTAGTRNAADYCRKALEKVDREYSPDRVPEEVLAALQGLAAPAAGASPAGDLPF